MQNHENHEQDPRKSMPDEGLLCDLAELYKIFGDSTRIKILYALFEEERGVGDIADLLGQPMLMFRRLPFQRRQR